MSDVLKKFGVDAAQVASLPTNGVKYPKPVPNRVAHIDADFMAYQVSAESKAELDPDDPTPRKTLEDMLHNAYEAVDHIRLLAAAETAVLHTTHNSDKGGRDEQAIQKEYQANRKDRANRPEQLDTIREFLGSGVGDTTGRFIGRNHTNQEADDGMTQALYADFENAILCSADKDLDMVPGLRLDMSSHVIDRQECHFGHIEIKEMGGGFKADGSKRPVTKKVIGRGTKFFWAQCLMGDTADNIQGVPMAPGSVWQEHAGTKAYKDAYAQWIAADDEVAANKIQAKLNKLTAKPKLCGHALTFEILSGARNDQECFNTVKACYVRMQAEHGYEFKHWKTGKVATPTQALLSEMRLLWMRRYPHKDDVIHWVKENIK